MASDRLVILLGNRIYIFLLVYESVLDQFGNKTIQLEKRFFIHGPSLYELSHNKLYIFVEFLRVNLVEPR